MDVKILDKVWIMNNNIPIELTITKIVITIMLDDDRTPKEDIKAYAIYSTTLLDECVVNLSNAYKTKDELMNAVFNLAK